MLNRVKSLFKIQLKNHNRPLRLMALMQIFQGPADAVLDSPALYKAILIFMYACHNYLLEPICSHVRQKLKTHPSQGNWSIITNPFRVQFFGLRVI